MAEDVQEVTQNSLEIAFVDEGYRGKQAERATKAAGIDPMLVKLSEAEKVFVLPPRRWVIDRSLARDFECPPKTLPALHLLAYAIPMLQVFVETIAHVL